MDNISFLETVKKYDAVWFGEIHGIRENYDVYMEVIPILAGAGFRKIIWEMDSDFSEKSQFSEDGRVNSYSKSFLKWLNIKVKEKIIDEVVFFGEILKRNDGVYPNNEEEMADQVIQNIRGNKCIVISGNFHMGGPLNVKVGVEPCLEFVKKKTDLKIIKIGLKYAGGTLYNFGIKHMTSDFYFGDKNHLNLGSVTESQDDDLLFISAGEAHAVFEN